MKKLFLPIMVAAVIGFFTKIDVVDVIATYDDVMVINYNGDVINEKFDGMTYIEMNSEKAVYLNGEFLLSF